MERRLAAILAADVVGYSRLIRADEEGTLAAFNALRAELIDPKLSQHHGRTFKLMGDGMLVEFASVVDAVRAAVETQEAVAKHNADLPEDKILVPGVIDSTTNFVEHPELVAERICRFTDIVGRERVIAGTDCGFATFAGFGAVDGEIAYAKLASMAEGAKIASERLWG